MKLFYSKQVAEIDKYTIAHEPVLSVDLMERAASQISNRIINKFENTGKFNIYVGPGNNGGDALVVARHLADKQFKVRVVIVKISDKLSPDAEINLSRLQKQNKAIIVFVSNAGELPAIESNSIVIDGLFGSGLSRPLAGLAARTVNHINNSKATIIAIDTPSGLFGEDNSENNINNIIKADYTFALQFPNISFMFPENEQYVGKFEILPIGLHQDAINSTDTCYFFIEKHDVKKKLKKRTKFSHKGNYGHALLISGSYGKMGAAILSAKACLRSGTGLLTVHVPRSANNILQIAAPEAMISFDKSKKVFSNVPDTEIYDAIGTGPGIGLDATTEKAFIELIEKTKKPLVIDADGINILAKNKNLLNKLPPETIITPHLKEFERLFGKFNNSYKRNKAQIKLSEKYNIIIALKGAHTAITTPCGKCYFNSTGNPGMATAGSGDVLTGIILSLLAQGYNATDATIISVYLHGLSADIVAEKISKNAVIAGDIIKYIGHAYKFVEQE